MDVYLRLSDRAWDTLSRESHSLGWVRQINTVYVPGVTSRYLGRYFEALAALTYHDARPEQFEDTCIWTEGEHVRTRHMSLATAAIAQLAFIAIKHRIPPPWYASMAANERVTAELDEAAYADVLANKHTTRAGLASATLEAIGLRWLLPDTAHPIAPRDLFRRKKSNRLEREQRIAAKYGV